MTMEIALLCQGRNCVHSFIRRAISPREIRNAARASGWDCAHDGTMDLCPTCVQARDEHTQRPGPHDCPGCYRSPVVDYRDSLGHDRTAHLVANLLARRGITTWHALLALTRSQMAAIEGMGPASIARVVWAQEHPGEKYLP